MNTESPAPRLDAKAAEWLANEARNALAEVEGKPRFVELAELWCRDEWIAISQGVANILLNAMLDKAPVGAFVAEWEREGEDIDLATAVRQALKKMVEAVGLNLPVSRIALAAHRRVREERDRLRAAVEAATKEVEHHEKHLGLEPLTSAPELYRRLDRVIDTIIGQREEARRGPVVGPESFARLRAFLEVATPRPWGTGKTADCIVATVTGSKDEREFYGGVLVGESMSAANRALAIEAVNAAPALMRLAAGAEDATSDAHAAKRRYELALQGLNVEAAIVSRARAALRDALKLEENQIQALDVMAEKTARIVKEELATRRALLAALGISWADVSTNELVTMLAAKVKT